MAKNENNVIGVGRFFNRRVAAGMEDRGITGVEKALLGALGATALASAFVFAQDVPTGERIQVTCSADTARIEGGPPASGVIMPQLVGVKLWTHFDGEGERLISSHLAYRGFSTQEAIRAASGGICQGGPVTLEFQTP